MASACINNIGVSPENFLDCPTPKYPSYGWLTPRMSFSREFPGDEASKAAASRPSTKNQNVSENADVQMPEKSDLEVSGSDFLDFEFCLEDPVAMLTADELFSDGKLVPLELSSIRKSMTSAPSCGVKSPATPKLCRRNEISSTDPYLFSPKAPRCSSRWKELLGLKKLYQNSNVKQDDHKTAPSSLSSQNNSNRNAARSLKNLLHRSSKSSLNASVDSSMRLPLLNDLENDSVSISARLSLSSSSSGHDHDDLPRLSLDSDKPSNIPRSAHLTTSNMSRVRAVRHRSTLSSENLTAASRVGRSTLRKAPEPTVPARGVSVDSPRMNSSGKIVFQSLERSSSSPSSFNGGPRHRHRRMERSYSANVRVTPVLNVPVCSLRGFPLFSSQQKKENGSVGGSKSQLNHSKNRTDRT